MTSRVEELIIEIGDQIIEDGQTILMNLGGVSNEVQVCLEEYKTKLSSDLIDKIIAYLMSQEIKLYQDECDENGVITESREVWSKIYESVLVEMSDDHIFTLKLIYSQEMMELLI
ncbi:hypothetical protein EZV73_11845 [Acidaminobacter sp. JC074]|uniref:hypothetical protein n=1 Tax=Acidaminobacter sp. JC074 TaxID=2530199 RepID=UPI001F11439B|nr:hypothetical protein [Acidaminobacter sp. JC074]MCH4888272.1 hypothetical protein [Acidaminobacter sp. JC074]